MLHSVRTTTALLALLVSSGDMSAQAPRTDPPPGVLVDVGGHKLHLRCVGPTGATATVILEAGGGGFSSEWSRVQENLAPRVRSCAYDRAGLGWSEAGPAPRTMHQEVFELHELLHEAKITGPLVLVGQSIGGLLVRLYAERYDNDVVGVVLVDPTHEDDELYNLRVSRWIRPRELSTGRAVPEPRRTGAPSAAYDPAQDFFNDELQAIHLARLRTPVPLGDRPLIVLAAGKRPAPPDTPDTLWNRLRVEKDGLRIDLSRLSRNARFVLDPSSGHSIHTEDAPLVARAIEAVLEAVAKGTSLATPLVK
jgi:pimeloyl-ACP methyl ester carboxylesterase